MKEILFRGKRVANGEFVNGDLIHGQGPKYGKFYILPHRHIYPKVDAWHVTPESIGQFTGLTDKNGNRIFEGDILSSEEYGTTMLVIWSNEKSAFMLDYYSDVRYFHDAPTDIGIIGNIHDNPELNY